MVDIGIDVVVGEEGSVATPVTMENLAEQVASELVTEANLFWDFGTPEADALLELAAELLSVVNEATWPIV